MGWRLVADDDDDDPWCCCGCYCGGESYTWIYPIPVDAMNACSFDAIMHFSHNFTRITLLIYRSIAYKLEWYKKHTHEQQLNAGSGGLIANWQTSTSRMENMNLWLNHRMLIVNKYQTNFMDNTIYLLFHSFWRWVSVHFFSMFCWCSLVLVVLRAIKLHAIFGWILCVFLLSSGTCGRRSTYFTSIERKHAAVCLKRHPITERWRERVRERDRGRVDTIVVLSIHLDW